MSTLEQAEAWGEAQAMARIAALEAEAAALREYIQRMLLELGVPTPDYPAPVAVAVDLGKLALAQPFDLAAHQKRMAREYVSQERVSVVMRRLDSRILPDEAEAYAVLFLAALFEEET